MTQTPISLTEYWNRLDRHDWFYEYADDHRAWRSGSAERKALQDIAQQDGQYRDLFNGFAAHNFSGPAFGTAKAPKPFRPLPLFD